MNLYTDDDVERGAAAMARHYAAAPFLTSDLTTTRAVLDAVLPAYRKRLLRELADEMVRKAVFETAAGNLISLYDALTVLGFDPLTFKADEVEGVSE